LTHPGEQLVIKGRGPPDFTRATSSDASSITVRSAPNEVSKTASNPMRRRAATSAPAESTPGLSPNSSAMVTETLGACWTTTLREGSRSASATSFACDCSCSAAVGQTVMHCPQLMQEETFRPVS